MPVRPPRTCGCGYRIAHGEKCPCERARVKQREQARPSARERGYDSKWEREAKAFLAMPANRLCSCGCGKPTDVVDHHIAHKGDKRLFWSRENWRPMARACNSRKAVRKDCGFGRPVRSSNTPGPSETFGKGTGTAWGQPRDIPEK